MRHSLVSLVARTGDGRDQCLVCTRGLMVSLLFCALSQVGALGQEGEGKGQPVVPVPEKVLEKVPGAIAPPVQEVLPCTMDLTKPGKMSDIVSNVLLRHEKIDSDLVKPFLEKARKQFATGDELLKAAAAHFKLDEKTFASNIERYKHINCKHPVDPGYVIPDPVMDAARGEELSTLANSAFAANVTLHVVLHELGHAVVREFDLPVLGNEETMADAFATHILVEHLPERALAAIKARVQSLMIEAQELPRERWSVRGEHDHDARRAYQIVALAIAADAAKYDELAELIGMSPREKNRAKDYGSDIHRAWRRVLTPLMMPHGRVSREMRILVDDSMREFVDFGEYNLLSSIEKAVGMIDWHSQVTIDFVKGKGGASWNRSMRTITVHGEYVRRFIGQELQATQGVNKP